MEFVDNISRYIQYMMTCINMFITVTVIVSMTILDVQHFAGQVAQGSEPKCAKLRSKRRSEFRLRVWGPDVQSHPFRDCLGAETTVLIKVLKYFCMV